MVLAVSPGGRWFHLPGNGLDHPFARLHDIGNVEIRRNEVRLVLSRNHEQQEAAAGTMPACRP
jgi:hypothetical protein